MSDRLPPLRLPPARGALEPHTQQRLVGAWRVERRRVELRAPGGDPRTGMTAGLYRSHPPRAGRVGARGGLREEGGGGGPCAPTLPGALARCPGGPLPPALNGPLVLNTTIGAL